MSCEGGRASLNAKRGIYPSPQPSGLRYGQAVHPSPRLVLFTRFPTPGMAKTRLIEAIGAEGAAAVHKKLTERTVKIIAAFAGAEVHITGADEALFQEWLGDGLALVPQAEGGLSERLLGALEPAPVLFFGADTPDLSTVHVAAALEALSSHDVVIGPAEDGGYYLIGVNQPHRFLFTDMPWSSDQVLPETLRRCEANGLSVALLETLSDCDLPEDLVRWPWLTA